MLSPKSINHKSGSAAYVTPSLQLGIKTDNGEVLLSEYPHIFVIGDAADAFGALKSGSAAWGQVSGLHYVSDRSLLMHLYLRQAEHAVRNIVRLIEGQDSQMEAYTAPPVGIKVSLGLVSLYRTGCPPLSVLIRCETPRNTLPTKRATEPWRSRKTAVRPWASITCGSDGVCHWMT